MESGLGVVELHIFFQVKKVLFIEKMQTGREFEDPTISVPILGITQDGVSLFMVKRTIPKDNILKN